MSELKKAIDILVKHLSEDDGYFYSWQANIAVNFQDYFKSKETLHEDSNNAAKNFLNTLINTRDNYGTK